MDYEITLKGVEENGSHYVVYGYFSLDGQFVELGRDDCTVNLNGQNYQLNSKVSFSTSTPECEHIIKKYVGLYDSFDYCEKCDHKFRS